MKFHVGRWWFAVDIGRHHFQVFNLLPRKYWGFRFTREWYDGEFYNLTLGCFNVVWDPWGVTR